MPLEPYSYQPAGSKHTTPSPIINYDNHGRRGSASSLWSTPFSCDTRATTPNRDSPLKGQGRDILPRIRHCDQNFEPEFVPEPYFRRAQSQDFAPEEYNVTADFQPLDFDDAFGEDLYATRPYNQRAVTCPPEIEYISEPCSTTTTTTTTDPWAFPNFDSATDSPDFYVPVTRNNQLSHGRSISTSAIDPASIRRHVYPYRTQPQFQSQSTPTQLIVPPYTQQDPTYDFSNNPFAPVPAQATHPLSREWSDLNPEFCFTTGTETTTTLSTYLTSASPSLASIVSKADSASKLPKALKHYWWDIRRLRPWTSFTLATINSIPGFPTLLSIPINASALPTPPSSALNLHPQSHASLHDFVKSYYATKVNAALLASQGQSQHATLTSTSSADMGPHFLAHYALDASTLPNSRGRVVGLTKCFEEWNTQMRAGGPNERVEYLKGLSHLHKLMRDNETRYGFLITEIELVCVKLPPTSTSSSSFGSSSSSSASTSTSSSSFNTSESNIPLFGDLELSPSIPLSTSSSSTSASSDNSEQTPELTALLALWYLHHLSSSTPLPGQEGWRVHVGAPAEWTRSRCCKDTERDEWIKKVRVGNREGREAKRVRGWVWCGEEYRAKVEGGRGRKREGGR